MPSLWPPVPLRILCKGRPGEPSEGRKFWQPGTRRPRFQASKSPASASSLGFWAPKPTQRARCLGLQVHKVRVANLRVQAYSLYLLPPFSGAVGLAGSVQPIEVVRTRSRWVTVDLSVQGQRDIISPSYRCRCCSTPPGTAMWHKQHGKIHPKGGPSTHLDGLLNIMGINLTRVTEANKLTLTCDVAQFCLFSCILVSIENPA